jgi:hypothetical protein
MAIARAKEILEHIRDSAQFILDATRDKTIDNFERDRVLRNAVERNFVAGPLVTWRGFTTCSLQQDKSVLIAVFGVPWPPEAASGEFRTGRSP